MANEKAILAWVADLRSGKYRQGKGQLRTPQGRYCCLGVACETFRRVTGRGRWIGKSDAFAVGSEREVYTLPESVSEWLGLGGNENPELRFPRSFAFCSEANDYKRRSFKEIADAVERTFLAPDAGGAS